MNKTLLSLSAVGLVGCLSAAKPQYRPVSIFDPYDYQKPEDEEKVLDRVYTVEDQSEDCLRSHYLGMENDQIKSFTVTEHCLSRMTQDSNYTMFRFEDDDRDGYANAGCVTRGHTFLGLTQYDSTHCAPLGNKMSQLMGLYNSRSMEEEVIPLSEISWSWEQ